VRWLCIRFHGFVNGHTRSFFEDIKSSPGFLSTAPGSIFQREALLRKYISLLLWGLLR
jgi:hypothetical protein